MIKRLIEYLIIERKTEYIQYENSLKSNSARNYTNYSTLKTISIKISTMFLICFKIIFLFILLNINVSFATKILKIVFKTLIANNIN